MLHVDNHFNYNKVIHLISPLFKTLVKKICLHVRFYQTTFSYINRSLISWAYTPLLHISRLLRCFPGGSVVKESTCNAGDASLIPRWRRYNGEGNGNPLQYFCLGNPMERGSWQTTVHRVVKHHHRLLRASKVPNL